MNKRGQTTLFIILGIIIVILITLLVIFREDIFEPGLITVPQQAQDVQTYMVSCMEDVTEEPLTLIGLQGGYITVPDDPIPDMPLNQFSNALEILPDSGFKTTYWFYEAANGVQHNQQPTKEEIEQELANYVTSNLIRCSEDFDYYIENGLILADDINTEVEILDNSVIFYIDYPLKMETDDFEYTFSEFVIQQDVPLGEMYDLASEIYETENEDFFLEEFTYDIMVIYDDIPVSGVEFDCERETWQVEEVKQSLMSRLSDNIPMLAIKNSNTDQNENYYLWDALQSFATDKSVDIRYSKQWPFSMQVEPSILGVMREDSMSSVSGSEATALLNTFMCLDQYNFVYDVKYPVLISLFDEDSGYTFQFAHQVIIDNNQPRVNEVQPEFIESEASFVCENADMPIKVYAMEVASDGSLVEVPDAEISYKCINSICPIGTTSGNYGSAFLFAKFPQCVNGFIIAEKPGLISAKQQVTTTDESTITVVLDKEYELAYDIMVQDGEILRSPQGDEVAAIILTHKNKDHIAFASWPKEEETISLIPGTYDLEALLVSEDVTYKLADIEYEKCVKVPEKGLFGIMGLSHQECVSHNFDGENLNSIISGGMQTEWAIDRMELINANKVTFTITALDVNDEKDVEDAVSSVYSGLNVLEPEFS